MNPSFLPPFKESYAYIKFYDRNEILVHSTRDRHNNLIKEVEWGDFESKDQLIGGKSYGIIHNPISYRLPEISDDPILVIAKNNEYRKGYVIFHTQLDFEYNAESD